MRVKIYCYFLLNVAYIKLTKMLVKTHETHKHTQNKRTQSRLPSAMRIILWWQVPRENIKEKKKETMRLIRANRVLNI